MSNYTIQSTALNKSRVFILQKSELEKRWDTYYYLPKFIVLEEKLKNKNIKNISQIAERIFSGSTPLSKGDAYTDDKNKGIPFVRSGDFTIEGTINFEDLVYLKEEVHNTRLKSSKLKRNDLLFAIVGATIGKVGVYKNDKPANINQAICAVRLKKEFNIDYLNAYFQTSLGQSLIDRIKRPVARANVNIDEISTLPVIIPNDETQQKIISIFNNSHTQKQKNEAEAEKLLAEIDKFLMECLQIALPEKIENNLKDRIFTTTLKKITGQRFDPTFHRVNYENFIHSILSSPFPAKKLKDIILFLDYGLMPTQDYAFTEDEGLPMIRVTNIMKDGYINMDKVEYIKFDTPKLQNKLVQENDILMVQCGNTTGKCAMVTKEFVGYTYGSFSFAIRANPKIINQHFLFYLLNSKVVQEQLNRSITITSVRPNTSKPEVENFLIPVPPLDKQIEIAEHITVIRQQAQQLKDKTKDDLKKASEEIEKILLN